MAGSLTVRLTFQYTYLVCPPDDSGIFRQSNRKQASLWTLHNGIAYMDNLRPLQQVIGLLNQQLFGGTTTTLKQHAHHITVTIRGSRQDVVNFARLRVLQSYSQVESKAIELAPMEMQKLTLAATSAHFFNVLDMLCEKYDFEYVVHTGVISLYGKQHNVTVGESQIRVLINTLLEELYVDTFAVDLSVVPLIGGVDLYNFNQIARQLNSNIYVLDLLPELFNSKLLGSTRQVPIYITTKSIPSVLVTKRLLEHISKDYVASELLQTSAAVFVVQELTVCRAKLDLITVLDQLRVLRIMFKYGVFIELPCLGESEATAIRVQGANTDVVHDAICEINRLCARYYTLQLGTLGDDVMWQLPHSSLCIVTQSKYGLEVVGLEQDIVAVLMALAQRPLATSAAKLIMEIDNLQRDFVSGKKNGKLLKVLNQMDDASRCIIEYEANTQHTFNLVLAVWKGPDVIGLLLKGIDLLQLELPAELTFNIPEVFHKLIIGNGGAIIQSIMKKHNVFIKFSSSPRDTVHAPQPGVHYSLTRAPNVLIKCPRKNARHINLVKLEIDELVYQCVNGTLAFRNTTSTTYLTTHFKILKGQYTMLLNAGRQLEGQEPQPHCGLPFILSLEQTTNTFIDFPKTLEDFAEEEFIFKIKGSDTKSRQAALQIGDILPRCFRFKIAHLPGRFEDYLINAATNDEFLDKIVYPFKILFGIELSVFLEGSNALEQPSYHLILLHYWDGCALDYLVQQLCGFLRLKSFLIIDKAIYAYDGIVDSSVHAQLKSPAKKLKPITNTTNDKATQSKRHNQKKKTRKHPRSSQMLQKAVIA